MTIHQFTPLNESKLCSVCYTTKDMHSSITQIIEQVEEILEDKVIESCEACPNPPPLVLIGKLLLCKDCASKELAAMVNQQVEVNTICDVCHEIRSTKKFMTLNMCKTCRTKEELLQENNKNETESRINSVIQSSRDIDDSIQVRTDLFNAATVSIVGLKTAIDTDESITNKPYRLAEELKRRFEHHKQVIFEMNEKIVLAGNEQKAIQVYLNQLANSLRQEEREKLKISDINYKPPSGIGKVKAVKTASSRTLNKAELRKYAIELGVNEFTIQMLVVSKGVTVEVAANMLRKSIQEAKSESSN